MNSEQVLKAEVTDELHKLGEGEFLSCKNTVNSDVLVLLARRVAPPDEEVC